MTEFPELDSWLTNKQLASYLGIRERRLTDARKAYKKKIGHYIPRKPKKNKHFCAIVGPRYTSR